MTIFEKIYKLLLLLVITTSLASCTAEDTETVDTSKKIERVDIYVSKSGSDSNPGTQSQPYASFSKAKGRVISLNDSGQDVVVHIGDGIYREEVEFFTDSDSTDASITFVADNPGMVILSGSNSYNGWNSIGNNTYTHAWNYNWGTPGFLTEGGNDTLAERRELVFINGNLLTQVETQSELVNETYYVNESSNLLYVKSTTDPNNALVEVGIREGLFTVNGYDNFTISGITFQHDTSGGGYDRSAVRFDNSDDVTVDNCKFNYNNWGGLRINEGDVVTVINSEANYNGGRGREIVRSTDVVVDGMETSHNGWRGALAGYTGNNIAGAKDLRIHSGYYNRMVILDNRTRGFWLDFDSRNIVVDNSIIMMNDVAGISFEANWGPMEVKNSAICFNGQGSGNRYGGIVATNSEQVTVRDSVIVYNRWGQIRPGGSNPRPVDDFETGEVSTLVAKNFSAYDNLIGGNKGDSVWYYASSSNPKFISTYKADRNSYFGSPFTYAGSKYDFSGWRDLFPDQEQNSESIAVSKLQLNNNLQYLRDICMGNAPPIPP